MQASKRTIRKMKVLMKARFPGEYALVVVERLRQQGIITSTQQVYNFFNNIPVKLRTKIQQAADQLLNEAQERDTQVEEIIKEAIL